MIFSLNQILQLLITYRYALIFPIAVLEGPIISIASGFLASNGYFNIYIIYGLLVLGDFVGDTIYYLIGRFGGHSFFKRPGKIFGIDKNRLTEFEQDFLKHSSKLLLFGKTQAIGSLILMVAGLVKMSYRRFIYISMAGTAVKTLILLLLGYYFGQTYVKINSYVSKIAIISSLIMIAIIILYVIHKRRGEYR